MKKISIFAKKNKNNKAQKKSIKKITHMKRTAKKTIKKSNKKNYHEKKFTRNNFPRKRSLTENIFLSN